MRLSIFTKIMVTFGCLMFVIPLWLIGFNSIKSAVEQGHFPLYEMAVFLGCPEWLPLVISILIFAVAYYLIIWRGFVKSIITGRGASGGKW